MATSTFYDKIVIEKKAAQAIIDGLKGPKHPRPASRENERKRSEELSKLYDTNLKSASDTKTGS